MLMNLVNLVAISSLLATGLYGGAIGVDGILGAEWTGITPVSVTYNSLAPAGNFGAPSTQSNSIAYDIYVRADGEFAYVFLNGLPAGPGVDGWSSATAFVNLYFDLNYQTQSGSDLGFELPTGNVFIPGGAPPIPGGLTNGVVVSSLFADYPNAVARLEVAIPWAYLQNDPQALGFPKITSTNNSLRLNLSQAFGYSVAGGQSNYGTSRLGLVSFEPVPEPGTAGLALSVFAIAAYWRRRHSSDS